MAARDKLGSTVSLQAPPPSSGEIIPREYHRKILKKIAQLTKVIYILNTKNDEHAEFVEVLRGQHEAELQRVEGEGLVRLERCEQLCLGEADGLRATMTSLREELSKVEGEREQLYQTQVSYRKEVEEKLVSLNCQHKRELEQLAGALSRLHSDQQAQLKQLAGLKDGFTRKADKQVAELLAKHKSELLAMEKQAEEKREKAHRELSHLRLSQNEELARLNQLHRGELETQERKLVSSKAELLAEEGRRWREREGRMASEAAQREEELRLSVSTLTSDLRTARDRLALAEQRARELESHCEARQADSSGTRKQLHDAEEEVKKLRTSLNTCSSELAIAKEQYKQQGREMDLLSAAVGELEAERVAGEGVVCELRSQLADLQRSLAQLEGEREVMLAASHSTHEQHSTSIEKLENELCRVKREREQLHTRYAHEIEAAHSKLSERESELCSLHSSALEDAKHQHLTFIAEMRDSNASTLEGLRRQLTQEKEDELGALRSSHARSVARLESSLEQRGLELSVATEQLAMLQKELLAREEGLGSASGELSRVTADLGAAKSELSSTVELWKEREAACKQLEALVGQFRREMAGREREHAEALKEGQTILSRQLEEAWALRLKQECGRLASELAERHQADSRRALEELTRLRDSQLTQAQGAWQLEQSRMAALISELEGRLKQEELSSVASMQQARSLSEQQLVTLKNELESLRTEHREQLDTLKQTHQHYISSLQQKHDLKMQDACEGLKQQHSQEMLVAHQTQRLAVQTLRHQLEQERQADILETERSHQQDLAALRCELSSQHEAALEAERQQHCSQLHKQRTSLVEALESKQKNVERCERSVLELQSSVEAREAELGRLRSKVNSLTVATSDLRKELEVKGQEVLTVRRETTNLMKIREQQLVSSHRAEMAASNADHRERTQALLADFNQAKGLLSARLSETEKLLAAAELRYKSRESRPEDLQSIRELKAIVKEHEHKMRELVAEKRIYQLELMNREKNYNKVFSANPQIGVLDPLEYKHKKDLMVVKATTRHSSAPSLLSPSPNSTASPGPRRLAPLDDSPLTLKRKINKSRLISNNAAAQPQTSGTAASSTVVQ